MNDFLTVAQVMDRLNQSNIKVSKNTVYNWIGRGLLPATRPSGYRYWIKEADFNRFLDGDSHKDADVGSQS